MLTVRFSRTAYPTPPEELNWLEPKLGSILWLRGSRIARLVTTVRK